jgi:LuxR family maltose regulon positive regulatory protein
VAAFAGDDRYVADYLVDEVLRRQPVHIQRFLLQTSILERLCGPLCDAILGTAPPQSADLRASFDGPASPGQAILELLHEANLFVISLDSRRRWYRYHRLFAELLRSRFDDRDVEQAAENHARASAWYESQGLILDAVSHAVAANDVERVADLVERYSGLLLRRGEFWTYCRLVDVLPEEMIAIRPLLCLARAWAAWIQIVDRTPLKWVERALALSAANPRPLREPDGPYHTDHELIRDSARLFRVGLAMEEDDLDAALAGGGG